MTSSGAINCAESASVPVELSNARVRHGYRPDIDGLRALAIALVVVFHLFKGALPNGFVGVDVFFVISGYVVTSSLMLDRSATALQELFGFWRRRIVRIYPALSVCVLITLVATLLFVPPFPRETYEGTIRTGLSALFGLGNVYLFRSQQNYFTSDQSGNPYVHTWSLGVEEQFYLVFSLVFIALPLLWRRIKPGPIRLAIVGSLTAASAALLLRERNAEAVFYLFQFRLWELGLGSLLAQVPAVRLPRVMREGASAFGIIAILSAAETSSVAAPALVFTVGAAATGLLLWVNAAGPDSTVVGSGLSLEPVRNLGILSYSLYLWHWPVIVLFGLTVGLRGPLELTAGVAAFTGLAAASYFLVERPLRSKSAPFSRVLLVVIGVSTAATVLGVAAHLYPGSLFAGRHQAWASEWLPSPEFPYAAPNLISARWCDLASEAPVSVPATCETARYRAASRSQAVLSVGDSLSFANWGMLSYGHERGVFEWAALSRDGCSVDAIKVSVSCQRYWATMPQRIAGSVRAGDFVLVATFWSLSDPTDHVRAISELSKLAAAAEAAGARLIVQAPLAQFSKDAFVCTSEWFRTDFTGCTLSRSAFVAGRAGVMARLAELRRRHPGVLIWDPIDQLCGGSLCSQFDPAGRPTFRNWDHLSYQGSRALGPTFAAFLRPYVRASSFPPT
jgi:peptidoglycan/LPS O-acetylase OafA/YrhL